MLKKSTDLLMFLVKSNWFLYSQDSFFYCMILFAPLESMEYPLENYVHIFHDTFNNTFTQPVHLEGRFDIHCMVGGIYWSWVFND